jgi:hypothetical protein
MEMLAVLLLLSLSAPSAPIHLTDVADVVVAVQRQFYSRCVVLLETREGCKYSRTVKQCVSVEKKHCNF